MDGLGDVCDMDRDGDRVDNWRDNCPDVINDQRYDWNRNNRGDACDDSDHDTVVDEDDNCIGIANTLQENVDRDGSGDVCDNDADGDGAEGQVSNPSQLDNVPVIT
jgi:hypothetical protein